MFHFQKLPFANECDLSRQPADQNQMFGMPSNLSGLKQQNNLAGPSDMEPEIELVSDDGKVEVIFLFSIFFILLFFAATQTPVVLNDQNIDGILLKANFYQVILR